jgi:hypothetical protein
MNVGQGATVFDWLVEMIREYAVGGTKRRGAPTSLSPAKRSS